MQGLSEQEIVPGMRGNSESQLAQDQLNKLKKKKSKISKTLDKTIQKNPESKLKIAKTGGKSMEPGGGGRFAAMVSNLKKKGKSEGSAKKIAAAIGRKKYGKSKFQEMAAKGKKGLGGMSDSTSSNDAGMDMMEAADPGDGKKHAARIRRRQARRTRRGRRNIGNCNRGEVCFD